MECHLTTKIVSSGTTRHNTPFVVLLQQFASQHSETQCRGRVIFMCQSKQRITELISVFADQTHITSGPLAAIAGISLDYAGYGIVGLFVVMWAAATAVWRWGHIEEKWSAQVLTPPGK